MILQTFAQLIFEFFKTGLFAIGGGLATVPFLREMATKYPWFSADMLSDMIAVSESTPGPIGINMATYAGFTAGYSVGGLPIGILGGIIATLSLAAPSIIIITIIAAFINHFLEYTIVQHILGGIRVAVAVLIINSVITMSKKSIVDKVCVIIAIISFLLSLIFSLSPILVVLAAGALGLILKRGGVKK